METELEERLARALTLREEKHHVCLASVFINVTLKVGVPAVVLGQTEVELPLCDRTFHGTSRALPRPWHLLTSGTATIHAPLRPRPRIRPSPFHACVLCVTHINGGNTNGVRQTAAVAARAGQFIVDLGGPFCYLRGRRLFHRRRGATAVTAATGDGRPQKSKNHATFAIHILGTHAAFRS